jgi:Uma2 family endonuclease
MTLPQTATAAAPPAAGEARLKRLPVGRRKIVSHRATPAERPWPPPQGQWTYEDWLRLPEDGWRYEVIKGVLYMAPAPTTHHQRASRKLEFAMLSFVERERLGEVFNAPVDVYLPGQETPVEPDLLFVSAERAGIISDRGIEGAPDLVVEISSPTTWWKDLRVKLPLYQETGVREYWVVDTEAKTVQVFVLRRGTYASLGQWGPGQAVRSEVLAGFQVDVETILTA